MGMLSREGPIATVANRSGGLEREDRESAFARHVDRRALDRAYRYATLMLGDRAEAEDAVHDAALSAWRRWDDLRDKGRFEPWFGRIVANNCRDRLRTRRRASVRYDDAAFEEFGSLATDDHAEGIARRQMIAAALGALDAEHREVVILRYFVDLTVDDIAARLGIRSGTVKSRLHYALRTLRDAVDAPTEGTRQ
jgi:RNA polymerase sigma-70 factor (ECF subfamily)